MHEYFFPISANLIYSFLVFNSTSVQIQGLVKDRYKRKRTRWCVILTHPPYTDIKENKIFLINKEIQSGAVAKTYMRKGFLIYEMQNISPYMRRPFVIFDCATALF